MNMFIRIFYGGYCKDISLQNSNDFYIGSRTDKGFEIPNSDMLPEHIRLHCENGNWTASRIGEIYLDGKPIETSALRAMQFYTLSIKNRISMLVINEYQEKIANVSLGKINELTIGRNEDNDIVLHSGIVSGNHAKISKTSNGYRIDNLSNSNGTFIDGKKIDSHILKDNDEVVICGYKLVYNNDTIDVYGEKGSVAVNVEKVQANNNNETEKRDSKIIFKRSPRLKLEIPKGDIEIQSPPQLGEKPEIDKISTFLPLMVTVGIAIVMAIFMNPIMLLYSLPMQLISGFMSCRNYKKQTKKFEEKETLRLEKYTQHLESIISEIEEKQDEQREAMNLSNPNICECMDIVKKTNRKLWSRRPSDSDFMTFRLGTGSINFSMNIKTPRTALSLVEDELVLRGKEIYDKYNIVKEMPINCSLLKCGSCGIVGTKSDSAKLVSNIVAQIATQHCYTEVKIIVVYNEQETPELKWIESLPHTRNNEGSGCYVAHNKKETEALFKKFEIAIKERVRDSEDEHYEKTLKIPYYVFVIENIPYIKGETISKYFYSQDKSLGVGTIFISDTIETLPKDCNDIVEIKGEHGCIYNKNTASQKQEFFVEKITYSELCTFGYSMKNIYCEEIEGSASIPKRISLFGVLGIKNAEDLDIKKRWGEADIIQHIKAPLGVKEKNELVYLDIHEDAQGPHGLVAGATGYGKSEVIQSYLLALATLYHPYELGFVIIDFKGGGMAKQFSELPHLIGTITDLDGKEIERSKQSIKAELNRRKEIFAQNGVNKIDDYMDKYKKHEVNIPLPHLIIIVDEFAELRAEQPDFMDDLTSTARIGRSLGVHLILATQKPAGQINDQIQSNAKFGICLKVKEKTDSQEVIKSPLAEKIADKGRAYLKVFEGNTLELFQSGYSGTEISKSNGSVTTEAKELVSYIASYCKNTGIERLPSICLPPLPQKIIYTEQVAKRKENGVLVPVGIFDNPAGQEQGVGYVNLEQNLFIIGASQTGKTNLLQSIIKYLSECYTPNEINIYIMDFASMTLKNYDSLNHVGGVVLSDEDEKLNNLLKLLENEIDRRKKRTIEVGVSSFATYIEGGYTDIPRIVLIIDNYIGYKERYDEEFDTELTHICREGLTYGISVIITSTQTLGFKHRLLSYFSERVAFVCNDNNEYSTLFDRCRMEPSNIAGRALIRVDGIIAETQTFIAFEGDKEIDRTAKLREYIKNINGKNIDIFAKPIPCIPDMLSEKYIMDNYEYSLKKNEYLIGLDYSTVDVVTIDFNNTSEYAIVGNSEQRNQEALVEVINQVKKKVLENPVKMYIIDAIERPLKLYSEMPFVNRYTIDFSEIDSVLDDIYDETQKRYQVLINNSMEELEKYPQIIVVINNKETIEYISSTKEVMDKYKQIQKLVKALRINFIFADIENTSVSFSAPEILKRLRDAKNAMLTDNLKETLFFDISPSVARNAKELQNDDAFFLSGNDIKRIKLIREES